MFRKSAAVTNSFVKFELAMHSLSRGLNTVNFVQHRSLDRELLIVWVWARYFPTHGKETLGKMLNSQQRDSCSYERMVMNSV